MRHLRPRRFLPILGKMSSAEEPAEPALRRIQLRFAGTCSLSGTALPKKSWALYDAGARTLRCIDCPTRDTAQAEEAVARIDEGVAGGSARREFARRRAAREARVKGRLGNFLVGVVLAVTDEPQHIRAWERGAVGEQRLAQALAGV